MCFNVNKKENGQNVENFLEKCRGRARKRVEKGEGVLDSPATSYDNRRNMEDKNSRYIEKRKIIYRR